MGEECRVEPLYKIGDRFREDLTHVANLVNVEIPQYVEVEYVSSEPGTTWGYTYFVKMVYASGRVDYGLYSENDLVYNFVQFDKVVE